MLDEIHQMIFTSQIKKKKKKALRDKSTDFETAL